MNNAQLRYPAAPLAMLLHGSEAADITATAARLPKAPVLIKHPIHALPNAHSGLCLTQALYEFTDMKGGEETGESAQPLEETQQRFISAFVRVIQWCLLPFVCFAVFTFFKKIDMWQRDKSFVSCWIQFLLGSQMLTYRSKNKECTVWAGNSKCRICTAVNK